VSTSDNEELAISDSVENTLIIILTITCRQVDGHAAIMQ